MSKYDVKFCGCGRIHLIDCRKENKILEDNKDLLLICGGCGAATLIGAYIEPDFDDPDKTCYIMYSREFTYENTKTVTISDFGSTDGKKGIGEIFYSKGIRVPMMTGNYATNCFDGKFSDMLYPDFYKVQRRDVTVSEIMEFIDEFNHDRTTVNMDRFIAENPDDILEEISHHYIRGFSWKDTKFADEYNP